MRMARSLTFLALGGAAKGFGVEVGSAVAVECEGDDDDGMAPVFGGAAYCVS